MRVDLENRHDDARLAVLGQDGSVKSAAGNSRQGGGAQRRADQELPVHARNSLGWGHHGPNLILGVLYHAHRRMRMPHGIKRNTIAIGQNLWSARRRGDEMVAHIGQRLAARLVDIAGEEEAGECETVA